MDKALEQLRTQVFGLCNCESRIVVKVLSMNLKLSTYLSTIICCFKRKIFKGEREGKREQHNFM